MLNNFIQNILDKIQGNSWGEGGVVYSEDIYERPIPFSKTIRRNNMKKAILVNDYASVEALNKLFDEGYTVESVDDRGVYILNSPEQKHVPIKNNIEAVVSIDASAARRQSKLLRETAKVLKEKYEEKQPHVRIEFDDIRDVPKVWVDGELIGDLRSNRPLVSLKVDWNTDTETENHKEFDINYQDFTGERPMSRGFREGSLM